MATNTQVFYDDFDWRISAVNNAATWNPTYWNAPVVSNGNVTTATAGYGWIQGASAGGYGYTSSVNKVPDGDFDITGVMLAINSNIRATVQAQASGAIVTNDFVSVFRANGLFMYVENTAVYLGAYYQGTQYLSTTTTPISLSTWYRYRLALEGQTLKLRIWPKNNAEVLNQWQLTYEFGAAMPTGGNIHVANKNQSTFYQDEVRLYTAGAGPEPEPEPVAPYRGWGLRLR